MILIMIQMKFVKRRRNGISVSKDISYSYGFAKVNWSICKLKQSPHETVFPSHNPLRHANPLPRPRFTPFTPINCICVHHAIHLCQILNWLFHSSQSPSSIVPSHPCLLNIDISERCQFVDQCGKVLTQKNAKCPLRHLFLPCRLQISTITFVRQCVVIISPATVDAMGVVVVKMALFPNFEDIITLSVVGGSVERQSLHRSQLQQNSHDGLRAIVMSSKQVDILKLVQSPVDLQPAVNVHIMSLIVDAST